MVQARKNTILPAAFFKIGGYMSLRDGQMAEEKGQEPLVKCTDLSGELIFVKFAKLKKGDPINTDNLIEFFDKKRDQMVTEKEILKVKDYLEENEAFEKSLEDLGLSRKEEREYIKTKASEIVKENWSVKPGTWIRGALSITKEEAEYEGNQYPIYESKTIIYDDENQPSRSGLYYISRNRYNVPIVMFSEQVWFNGPAGSIENFQALIKHSMRTAKKNVDFLVEFESRDIEFADTCRHINTFKKQKNYKRYQDGCNFILNSKDPEVHKKVYLKLPRSLTKVMTGDHQRSDSNSMLNTLGTGVRNIYLSKVSDVEKDEIVSDFISNLITNDRVYGFYDIMNIGDDIEADSYGFLPNNLNPRKTYYDINTLFNKLNELDIPEEK